jgi:predicted nuclease of predicted toxin-antitoxin system
MFFSVFEKSRGISDEMVIKISMDEKRIIITADKDFGELIFRMGMKHCGVILLRLVDERSVNKIEVFDKLLNEFSEMLTGAFVVVTEKLVRFAR